MEGTEVTGDNFAFTHRGAAAAEAEDGIIFPILETEVIRLLFVAGACPTQRLNIIAKSQKRKSG